MQLGREGLKDIYSRDQFETILNDCGYRLCGGRWSRDHVDDFGNSETN